MRDIREKLRRPPVARHTPLPNVDRIRTGRPRIKPAGRPMVSPHRREVRPKYDHGAAPPESLKGQSWCTIVWRVMSYTMRRFQKKWSRQAFSQHGQRRLVGYMKNVYYAPFSAIRKFIRDLSGEKVSTGYLAKVI